MPVLQVKHGGALRGVNLDLNHGLRGACVRREGVGRHAPGGGSQGVNEGRLRRVTLHLAVGADEPMELVPVGSLGD